MQEDIPLNTYIASYRHDVYLLKLFNTIDLNSLLPSEVEFATILSLITEKTQLNWCYGRN